MSIEQTAEVFRRVRDGISVGSVPVEQVIEAGRRYRRVRRGLRAGTAVSVVVGVVGAGLLLPPVFDRPGPIAGVVAADNPANVAWWADGVLHLDDVQVTVPGVTELVDVPDGVVYGNEQGEVVAVADDGASTTLGRKVAGAPLVASADSDWVAWVDPRQDDPVLVVYDTQTLAEVARWDLDHRGPRWGLLDAGSYPIAIDQGVVYFAAQDGDYRWPVREAEPQRILSDQQFLLDHQGGVEVTRPPYADGDKIHFRPAGRDSSYTRAGNGAQLSPDGRYLIPFGPHYRVRVYDTSTGNLVPTGLATDRPVMTVAFGPDNTATYLLGHPAEPADSEPVDGIFLRAPSGPFDLVTCRIRTQECAVSVRNASDIPAVVLPS